MQTHYAQHHLTRKYPWLAVLALTATTSHAEVIDTLSYDYYDVQEKSGQTLTALLNRATPFKEGNRSFHGYTKWNIRWTFSYKENSSGACRIETVKVNLDTIITLPRLVGDNEKQQRQLEQYLIPLKQHELGHYRIAQEGAAAAERTLASMPSERSCANLSKAANAASTETVNRYNEKNRGYDITTDHGKSQGAIVRN